MEGHLSKEDFFAGGAYIVSVVAGPRGSLWARFLPRRHLEA